jgi:DNA-binding NarL/FixJ family response regulator
VNVRVLIADDDPVMRMLMGAIVRQAADLELAGEAADAEEAIEAALRLVPDVVLLDVEMPKGGGLHAAREIAAQTRAQILALSAHETDAARAGMTEAGAVGYVVKGAPPQDVIEAIREAALRRP